MNDFFYIQKFRKIGTRSPKTSISRPKNGAKRARVNEYYVENRRSEASDTVDKATEKQASGGVVGDGGLAGGGSYRGSKPKLDATVNKAHGACTDRRSSISDLYKKIVIGDVIKTCDTRKNGVGYTYHTALFW